MSAPQFPPTEISPELIWLGDGAWVTRDRALADDDPHGILAYVEHKDHRVYVLWVRDRHDVEPFDTLRDAVHELAVACVGRSPAGGGMR